MSVVVSGIVAVAGIAAALLSPFLFQWWTDDRQRDRDHRVAERLVGAELQELSSSGNNYLDFFSGERYPPAAEFETPAWDANREFLADSLSKEDWFLVRRAYAAAQELRTWLAGGYVNPVHVPCPSPGPGVCVPSKKDRFQAIVNLMVKDVEAAEDVMGDRECVFDPSRC